LSIWPKKRLGLELRGNSPLVGADLVSALFAIQIKYRVKEAKEKIEKIRENENKKDKYILLHMPTDTKRQNRME